MVGIPLLRAVARYDLCSNIMHAGRSPNSGGYIADSIRPDRACSNYSSISGVTQSQWHDTSNDSAPQASRGTGRGPHIWSLNMRLAVTFACVGACLVLGGRFAWNALELDDWMNGSDPWSISSLMKKPSEGAPKPESSEVLFEDSLVPTLMLPKVQVLDRLEKPTRGSFGSRHSLSGQSSSISGAIVIPPSARAGSNKSISPGSTSGIMPKIGAYDSAPQQAYGLNNRSNPLTAALDARNYVRPRFNFTSEGRKQSNGNPNRKPTRSSSRD